MRLEYGYCIVFLRIASNISNMLNQQNNTSSNDVNQQVQPEATGEVQESDLTLSEQTPPKVSADAAARI